MTSLNLKGYPELMRVLRRLPGPSIKRVARASLRAGAKPINERMKINARSLPPPPSGIKTFRIGSHVLRRRTSTGLLSRSIGIIAVPEKKHGNKNDVVVNVGARGPDKFREEIDGKIRNPFRYAHLVEFGNKWMPARPFGRQAFASRSLAALHAIEQRVPREMTKEIARLRRKGKGSGLGAARLL